MTGKPATKWGQCSNPDCAGEYSLHLDGKVRRHPKRGFTYANSRDMCQGSQKYPAQILPDRPIRENPARRAY